MRNHAMLGVIAKARRGIAEIFKIASQVQMRAGCWHVGQLRKGCAHTLDGAAARALVFEAPRSLIVGQFPVPVVGDDDALERVVPRGLCGDRPRATRAIHGALSIGECNTG